MKATAFLVLLALGLLLAPLAADAQPLPKVPRIGVLSSFSLTAESHKLTVCPTNDSARMLSYQ